MERQPWAQGMTPGSWNRVLGPPAGGREPDEETRCLGVRPGSPGCRCRCQDKAQGPSLPRHPGGDHPQAMLCALQPPMALGGSTLPPHPALGGEPVVPVPARRSSHGFPSTQHILGPRDHALSPGLQRTDRPLPNHHGVPQAPTKSAAALQPPLPSQFFPLSKPGFGADRAPDSVNPARAAGDWVMGTEHGT